MHAMLRGDFEHARESIAALPRGSWSLASRAQTQILEDLFPCWLASAEGRHADAIVDARERVNAGRRMAVFTTIAFAGWIVPWLTWRAGQPPDEDLMEEAE